MRCIDKEAIVDDYIITLLLSDLTTDELYILLEYNKYRKRNTQNRQFYGNILYL